MSLPHVILSLLNQHSMSGYDITKEFEGPIGHAWTASHQQVYRELIKLDEKEMVTFILFPKDGKPDRKEYSITDDGRKELIAWLSTPNAHGVIRDTYAAKLFGCTNASGIAFRTILTQSLEKSRQRYTELTQEFANINRKRALLSRKERLERLAIRRNMLLCEAWNVWAEETIDELRFMD